MFALSQGESTGHIVKSLISDEFIINTTHYSVEECNQGMHYHENPHICFLFQGKDVENRNNQTYERKTGDIYFYYAGEKHASIFRKALTKHINIEFGKDFFQRSLLSEDELKKNIQTNSDAKFFILKIQQELLLNDTCSHLAIHSLLLNLTDSSKSVSQTMPNWLKQLDNLLNDRWNEQITLEEIANAVEKYPTTISKYFRKYFFCTLGEYLRKIRISKSLDLIKNSDMPLTDIAFHCGFADQSHFTRNFRAMTGFLPKEFRKI